MPDTYADFGLISYHKSMTFEWGQILIIDTNVLESVCGYAVVDLTLLSQEESVTKLNEYESFASSLKMYFQCSVMPMYSVRAF